MSTAASNIFEYSQPFRMKRGGELPEFRLVWESWGKLNRDRSNAILILTGLSPSAHAASSEQDPKPGWWEFMIGPGKPLDTDRWFIVCANSLGSCMGSTGPASINEETGRVWGPTFPELCLEDVAATAKLLVEDALDIKQVHTVIGPSMGGMTALGLCGQFPGFAKNMISISSGPHATPFAIAIRSLQREAIRRDPNYRDGYYHDGPGPVDGMRIARKLGMLSYRSAAEWLERFGRDRIPPERASGEAFAPEFEIESYLEAHADKFIGGFDPNCYLYLSRAMDWFDALEYGETVDDALASLQLERTLVIGVQTDVLFPIRQQEALAAGLARGGTEVTFQELPSIEGHDAFLVDERRFAPTVHRFMISL